MAPPPPVRLVLSSFVVLGAAAALTAAPPIKVTTAEELLAAVSTPNATVDVVKDVVLGNTVSIPSYNNVTIYSSAGASISGNHTVRIFYAQHAKLTISNITLKDGTANGDAFDGCGGAIRCGCCNVEATGVIFTHNYASDQGGAIFCDNYCGSQPYSSPPCRVKSSVFTYNVCGGFEPTGSQPWPSNYHPDTCGDTLQPYNGQFTLEDCHFGGNNNASTLGHNCCTDTECPGTYKNNIGQNGKNCDLHINICDPYVGCNVCDACCNGNIGVQQSCDTCTQKSCSICDPSDFRGCLNTCDACCNAWTDDCELCVKKNCSAVPPPTPPTPAPPTPPAPPTGWAGCTKDRDIAVGTCSSMVMSVTAAQQACLGTSTQPAGSPAVCSGALTRAAMNFTAASPAAAAARDACAGVSAACADDFATVRAALSAGGADAADAVTACGGCTALPCTACSDAVQPMFASTATVTSTVNHKMMCQGCDCIPPTAAAAA